jgi:hypothetical protein
MIMVADFTGELRLELQLPQSVAFAPARLIYNSVTVTRNASSL